MTISWLPGRLPSTHDPPLDLSFRQSKLTTNRFKSKAKIKLRVLIRESPAFNCIVLERRWQCRLVTPMAGRKDLRTTNNAEAE